MLKNIQETPIRRALLITIAITLLLSMAGLFNAYAAEKGETERLITQMRPPPKVVEKDTVYLDSYYEPSNILQGNSTGRWSEITNTFGYAHQNITSYGYISQLSRLGVLDYTANLGTYINIDKDQNAHFEIGFGWDIDYIYRLQITAEYSHKLYKTLFWQVGYNYREYSIGDSHILYPGLIYYFGDHYISANYGANWIEGRETVSFGSIKGNFVITDRVQLWSGIAFGQRLYDIFGIKGEDGYILFGGLTVNVYKGINIRAGGSYGHEDPKFIKRSLIFDVSVKF